MLIQQERFPIRDILLYGFLPGFIKKTVYRIKGYHIGKNVSFGFGAVICGDSVHVGDNTSIGFFTIIRGRNIKIGSFVNIGATTMLDTPHLEIGDGSRINEQVFVGGLQFPDSKLVLGRNCQIMQRSFINPTKSIVVGDDSGIGGDSLLFGHNSWLSQFEGYPVEFDTIEIGKSVSVSWRVFLLPGTKIGDGAVIGANSLVRSTIPPKCLAVGFPARVVSKYPDFPRPVSDIEKVDMLRDIVHEMLNFFTGSDLLCEKLGNDLYEVTQIRKGLLRRKKKKWRMRVQYDVVVEEESASLLDPLGVFLSLRTIPDKIRESLSQRRVMWIDIERKEQAHDSNDLGEEVALYLKRYGVRLSRV